MSVVYVKEQGAYIRQSGEHLVVEKSGCTMAEIPIHTLTSLSVIGKVQVTTQALHLLMQEGVDVSFFSYSGEHMGQIAAQSSKNIFLRFAQYELYMDYERRLQIAKEIVANKIRNQMQVIRKFRWNSVEGRADEEQKLLQEVFESLQDKKTTNEVMGVEGICSKIYFSAYGKMFKSNLKFEKRTKRPPKDPVNVILSLGYTLLTKEITALLEAEAFEVYMGFLHGIRYGRKSLPCDMVEEFRQPVIDRLTLTLFNKRMIQEEDFEFTDGKVILKEIGFQKFIRAYEKWMDDESQGKSFRTIMKQQVWALKTAIRNCTAYAPYAWRENVSSEL